MDMLIPVNNAGGGPVKTTISLSAGTDTVQADDISFGLIMSAAPDTFRRSQAMQKSSTGCLTEPLKKSAPLPETEAVTLFPDSRPDSNNQIHKGHPHMTADVNPSLPRPSLFEQSPHTSVSAGAKPSPALRNLPDIPGIIKILPVTAKPAGPLLNPVPHGPNQIDNPIGNPAPHRVTPDIPGIIRILPVTAEPAGPLLNPVPPGPNPINHPIGNPALPEDTPDISSKNTMTSPSGGQQISEDINPVKNIPGNGLSISGESIQPVPATAKVHTEDIPENILLHTGNKGHNEPPAEIRNMTKPSGVNHIETASLIKKDDVISMKVSLDPDGLGRLDIRLVLNKGIINGHINTSDIIGKEVMEKNLDNIIYTLIKDGLNVGGLSVSLRNKGNETAYNHGGKERHPARSARSAGEIRMPAVHGGNRMVNIFI